VTHDAGRQGRVVALGAERFALDARTCQAILVDPLPTGAGNAVPVPVPA